MCVSRSSSRVPKTTSKDICPKVANSFAEVWAHLRYAKLELLFQNYGDPGNCGFDLHRGYVHRPDYVGIGSGLLGGPIYDASTDKQWAMT